MKLNDLINKENITFALSIFGATGTILTWVISTIKHRKNIKLSVIDYNSWKNINQFFITIQNKSHSKISISSIQIVHNKQLICCELEPKIIKSRTNAPATYTPQFPLNINGMEGFSVYLEFINCQDMLLTHGKTVDFQVYTNRGQIKKSIILGDISHYLHSK